MIADTRKRLGQLMRGLEVLATLAVLLASVTIIWKVGWVDKQQPSTRAGTASANTVGRPLPPRPIVIDGATIRGSAKAPLAVIEYSEFQCPFCARFAMDTFPKLAQAYVEVGKVAWVYRHFPLESIHPFAFRAAEAAECAKRQNRFWEMHELLFSNQKKLDDTSLRSHAQTLGLSRATFEACLNGEASDKVRTDQKSARALGLTGTPTFFIGVRDGDSVVVKHRLAGNTPFEEFRDILDDLLAAK